MHRFKLTLFLIFWVISLTISAQVKKSIPQAKASVKTGTIEEKGSLDPQDYKYYFLARRGGNGSANNIYTLKERSAPATNLSAPLAVMDARTMKELTWWPEIETSVKQSNLYGYKIDRTGPLLIKYTSTGKYVFSKYLTWQTPTGEKESLSKSNDDKHVFAIYNNDVWAGDFDLSAGSVSNMHQVTQSGVMKASYYGYLRNDILLLDDYVVNIKDGRYTKSWPYSYILTDTCHFYNIVKPGDNPNSTWLLSFDEWNKYRAFTQLAVEGNQEVPVHWIDRGQTKVLWSRTKPTGQTSQFIRTYIPNTVVKPVDVTWTQHVATKSNEFWGPLLELAVSPNSKYLITPGFLPNTNNSVLYVYNLETLAEYFLPINLGTYPPDETAWTDDTHLLFTMRSDRMNSAMLNEQTRITSENQGTYILDVETKQVKRLTPYLLGDYDKNFVRLLGSKTVLFDANNYIFRCNSDGTELTQLTKIPGVYKLAGAFIK